MKLEEGISYNFRIHKIIEISNIDYYVFAGPDKKKYLLPVSRYSNYGLSIGQQVECRVDKINCKGEVFLEPFNPFYNENEFYDFKVYGTELRIDSTGAKLLTVIVKDRFGDEISVPAQIADDKHPEKGEILSLRINKISKGKIQIAGYNSEYLTGQLKEYIIYDFLITEEIKGLDNRKYFIVKDPLGTHHTLPADYYGHYGLRVGEIFKGSIRQYREDKLFRVEPQNPFFTPGEFYTFVVKQLVSFDEKEKIIAILKDEYGFEHKFDTSDNLKIGAKLHLRVTKIRKGWPLLDLV